ncbi:tetratricopeptide repeat protein [Macrococcus equipercicus]|uniref:Tetratricopeptide repeat protein n=1 Tax=Macrococcus equipercicus TaxID=69967 RepID=A0A9Q9BM92_9STAP|nr:tetratricopeptide repeat protein [Macrococcus equipercicus]KAA1037634.1 tetratricopeptide repeat protein [Macrococcus equipercicus]UTH14148.1 tetratricopeptide repeat protein [Macrococcus equipercicus]
MDINTTIDQAFEAFHEGDEKEAERLFATLKNNVKPEDEDYTQYLSALGYFYTLKLNLEKAKEVYQRLLEGAESAEDKYAAIHELGIVSRMDSEFEAAKDYFAQEAAIISTDFADDDLLKSVNRYELGYVYMQEGKYTEAVQILKEALQLAEKAGDALGIGSIHRALGELNAAQDNQNEAKEHFKLAKKNFKNAGEEMSVQEIEMLESIIFED